MLSYIDNDNNNIYLAHNQLQIALGGLTNICIYTNTANNVVTKTVKIYIRYAHYLNKIHKYKCAIMQ